MKTLSEKLTVEYVLGHWERNSMTAHGMSDTDILAYCYKSMRNRLYDYMRQNKLEVNWSYEFHFDAICEIDRKICRMRLEYGPVNRVPLWKIETYLAKQRLGLLND